MDPLFLRHIDIPPKAVPTRPIRRHGLFAFNFVKQHMMIDERWMPNSTSEQFARLSQLLRMYLKSVNGGRAGHNSFNLLFYFSCYLLKR